MAGCDLLQGCSVFCCPPVRELIDAEVNSPYVKITVGGAAGTITVGNKSQPAMRNHAVVKSLKFGHTGGGGGGAFSLEVEVADEAGGSFATFVNNMVTQLDFGEMRSCNWIKAEWGWISSTCDGMDRVTSTTKHTALLLGIDFQYTHGLMKFNLKCNDPSGPSFQTSTDKTYGTDDAPMPLKEAIRQICSDYECDIDFFRPDDDSEWNFGSPGTNGGQGDPDFPKHVWKAHGEPFIQAIMRWIRPYKTDRNRGIVPAFDSEDGPSHLILWESYVPECGQVKTCDEDIIGTYIVNGGKHSPVISFQPNLKWNFASLNRSGGASSTTANQQLAETGDPDCDTGPNDPIEQGSRTYNVVSDDAVYVYGTQTALANTQDAQLRHARANQSFNSIEGELRIQGDPTLADPIGLYGKNVSLVVINPFHIQDVSDTICGDWLQAETCNTVLSNRRWMIRGTSHEIKEGSYTTTLKLFLAAPGAEVSIGEPFGQDPEGFSPECGSD